MTSQPLISRRLLSLKLAAMLLLTCFRLKYTVLKKKINPFEAVNRKNNFDMSQKLDGKLQAILEKVEKLDIIESTLKSIQANLTKLESRTQKVEQFQTHAKKEVEDLQEGARFAKEQLK